MQFLPAAGLVRTVDRILDYAVEERGIEQPCWLLMGDLGEGWIISEFVLDDMDILGTA